MTSVQLLRGIQRLHATSAVLQRARRGDPTGGLWEAADVQWWWRRPRSTDDLALPVWLDDDGPVGAVALTDWGDRWQCDALVVPGATGVEVDAVWSAVVEAADAHAPVALEVLARADDARLLGLLASSGFSPTEDRSGLTWMDAARRPPVAPVPDGFRIVDRTQRRDDVAHPMHLRNGPDVEARLAQCPLYDPTLDLSAETLGGDPAGYALFWLDRSTGVGMLEPMRVEDAYQRRGLARALLTEGLHRLAGGGASRLKVGFDGPAGEALYLGAGFEPTASVVGFARSPSIPPMP